MGVFTPDLIFTNVSAISPEKLLERGIQGIILDLDGTLCVRRTAEVSETVARWLSSLHEAGLKVALLSNTRQKERAFRVCREHRIRYCFYQAFKPLKRGFSWVKEAFALPAGAIAMVGDQVYTDVLGANRLGMVSIYVYSMDTGRWYLKLRHFFEKPFLFKNHADRSAIKED